MSSTLPQERRSVFAFWKMKMQNSEKSCVRQPRNLGSRFPDLPEGRDRPARLSEQPASPLSHLIYMRVNSRQLRCNMKARQLPPLIFALSFLLFPQPARSQEAPEAANPP